MRRLVLLLSAFLLAGPGETMTGTVVDENGAPIEGARVRLRAAETFVITDADGRFAIADPAAGPGRELTAARPGHIIGGVTLKDGLADHRIQLPAIPPGDDPTYPWVTAFPEDDKAPRTDFGREPCGACHRRIFAEWQESAHSRAATNPRFLAFLDGNNDLSFARDPQAARADCGSCHTPMVASGDPGEARDVGTEGVGCDFCHKIAEARPGEHRRTGIRVVDLRRPPFGRQTVFGPFDDVPRGRDSFAPVFAESRYCAACHQQRAGNVPIYSEFEEWEKSRYAAEGVTCQSCHMRGDAKSTTMSDLGPGRIERPASTLSSHRFHDARSPTLLSEAIRAAITAAYDGEILVVAFEIANQGGGHHLPAGSPMRHMVLTVDAETDGRTLTMVDGPTLPAWAGDDIAGKPGRAYAKRLRDASGAAAPPWRAVALEDDTRIAAGGRDRTVYRFRSNGSRPVNVTATVTIRRTFPAWAEASGVDVGELQVGRYTLTVRR